MARTHAHRVTGLPPRWDTLNTDVILWHGCVQLAAEDIQANGVDLTKRRNNLDFGQGFYTTTSRPQAEKWAHTKHSWLSPTARAAQRPALIQFRLPLGPLARLESLMFVRGDPGHDAFWSLVHHCRNSTNAAPRTHLHSNRVGPDDWYDVVCGPLAAAWPPQGRVTIPGSDQFTFHTSAGATILNGVIAAGTPDFQVILL